MTEAAAKKTEETEVTYDPLFFDPTDFEHAKKLTLGDIGDEGDDQRVKAERRWVDETKYTLDLIEQKLKITSETVIVDYGCGTGRIAKGLIERHHCKVIGVDENAKMGKLAVEYVNSENFEFILSKDLWAHVLQVDFVICVFVLQHCHAPNQDLNAIKRILKSNAQLFVINEIYRMLPVERRWIEDKTKERGWIDDEINIESLTSTVFGKGKKGKLDPEIVTQDFKNRTYWAIYTKQEPPQYFEPKTKDIPPISKTVYNPSVFDVRTLKEAKQTILHPISKETDERWESETEYNMQLLDRLNLTPDSMVLDYGCGVGRLAKELILNYGCWVVGADISASMRTFANAYVNSPKFLVCAPQALEVFDFKFDAAIAVWVLQHCPQPKSDLDRIKKTLKVKGDLFVLNSNTRWIPTSDMTWVDDYVLISDLLSENFDAGEHGYLPDEINDVLSSQSFWRFYKRKHQAASTGAAAGKP